MSPEWKTRQLHFIGIGGAGMSGLALVAAELGADVTGSDRSESSYLQRVRNAGIEVFGEHDSANLPEGADVVISTAIAETNPELSRGREEGRRILHRSDLLAEFCAEKRTIAVAGTHGKTTTTGMLIHALRKIGEDPAFFVGGELPGVASDGGASNSGWGKGEWAIVEADESDGSFLVLDPEVAVITNIEMDHHSRWSGLVELREAFESFAGKARAAVLPAAQTDLAESLGSTVATFFDVDSPGPATLDLAVPGKHNRLNARAAIGAMEASGIEVDVAARALGDFPGVRRRLEYKGRCGGSRVYDDYAHHPTEVEAALTALREFEPERLVAIFQPHLYSRTKVFRDSFGAALAFADEVIVLDVYPAREEPVGELAGVSGLDVLRATADRSGGRASYWAPTSAAAEEVARSRAVEGGILVTIGAGDVTRISDRLATAAADDDGSAAIAEAGDAASAPGAGEAKNG